MNKSFLSTVLISLLAVFFISTPALALAPWLEGDNQQVVADTTGVDVPYLAATITTPEILQRPKGLSEEEMYYFEKSGQPMPTEATWYKGKNFVYAESGKLMKTVSDFAGQSLEEWSVPVAYLLENILQHNYNYVFSPENEILVDVVKVENTIAVRLTGPVFNNIRVPFGLNSPLTMFLARQIEALKRRGGLSPNSDAGAALTFVSDRFKKHPASFLYYREQERLINKKTVPCIETVLVIDMADMDINSVSGQELNRMYERKIQMFNRCFDSRLFAPEQIAAAA